MGNISLVSGDITKAKADAIVNAANPKMLGGGGVDGVIHKAAGPKLLEACLRVKPVNGIRCPFGEARITEAGDLSAKYVIHTVGPRYRIDENPGKLLRSAFINSLTLAIENDCENVALPAVSCGAYGYPLDEAADIAFEACRMDQFKKLSITFYLFGSDLGKIWDAVLSEKYT